MAKSLRDQMRWESTLRKHYLVLENQKQVMDALAMAMQLGYGESDWYDKANGLLHKVATEVYKTCEAIWQLSEVEKAQEPE